MRKPANTCGNVRSSTTLSSGYELLSRDPPQDKTFSAWAPDSVTLATQSSRMRWQADGRAEWPPLCARPVNGMLEDNRTFSAKRKNPMMVARQQCLLKVIPKVCRRRPQLQPQLVQTLIRMRPYPNRLSWIESVTVLHRQP